MHVNNTHYIHSYGILIYVKENLDDEDEDDDDDDDDDDDNDNSTIFLPVVIFCGSFTALVAVINAACSGECPATQRRTISDACAWNIC